MVQGCPADYRRALKLEVVEIRRMVGEARTDRGTLALPALVVRISSSPVAIDNQHRNIHSPDIKIPRGCLVSVHLGREGLPKVEPMLLTLLWILKRCPRHQ